MDRRRVTLDIESGVRGSKNESKSELLLRARLSSLQNAGARSSTSGLAFSAQIPNEVFVVCVCVLRSFFRASFSIASTSSFTVVDLKTGFLMSLRQKELPQREVER